MFEMFSRCGKRSVNYKKKELEELSALYNIPLNTLLSQQKKGKQAIDTLVIKNIVSEREVSIEQFLKLFEEDGIARRLEEIEKEPYSSISPLKLAIIEMENENSIFIDDTLLKNRDKIESIRKTWWSA